LKLDGPGISGGPDGFPPSSGGESLISGETLLAEALKARKEYDLIEHPGVDNLLTSFFLFAAYGNMDG